jgi:hypothetical protein
MVSARTSFGSTPGTAALRLADNADTTSFSAAFSGACFSVDRIVDVDAMLVLRLAIGFQQGADDGPQLLARLGLAVAGTLHGLAEPVEMAADDVVQQHVLAVVVVIEKRLGGATRRGHLRHGGALVALPGEQFGRPGENGLALLVVVLRPRTRHASPLAPAHLVPSALSLRKRRKRAICNPSLWATRDSGRMAAPLPRIQ